MLAPQQKPDQEACTPAKPSLHLDQEPNSPSNNPDHTNDIHIPEETRYLTQRIMEIDKTLDERLYRYYRIWLSVVASLSFIAILNVICRSDVPERSGTNVVVNTIDATWSITQSVLAFQGSKQRNLRKVNIALGMMMIYAIWIVVGTLGQDFKLAKAYQEYQNNPDDSANVANLTQQSGLFVINFVYFILHLTLTIRGSLKVRKLLNQKKSLELRITDGPYSTEGDNPVPSRAQLPPQGIYTSQGIIRSGGSYAQLEELVQTNRENMTEEQRNIVTQIETIDNTLNKEWYKCLFFLFCVMFGMFFAMVINLIIEARPVESDYNYLLGHITYTWNAVQYLVAAIALKKKDLLKANIALVMITCFEIRRVYELIIYEKPYQQSIRDDWAFDIAKKLIFVWVYFGAVLFALVKARKLLSEREMLKEKLVFEFNKSTV